MSNSKLNMEHWLDRYPPSEDFLREREEDHGSLQTDRSKKQLRRMEPQAVLDLHGFTADEAAREIDKFLTESFKAGLRKVIIVHGKGIHSSGEGVLSKLTEERVSKHPLAGENSLSKGPEGGSGARWVILRQRSR